MPYPFTRSQAQPKVPDVSSKSTAKPAAKPTAMPPARPNRPTYFGIPFRRMYEMRDEVQQTRNEISKLEDALREAQRNPKSTQIELQRHQEALRFKHAELKAHEKSLRSMEAKFENAKPAKKRNGTVLLEPQPKKLKLDDRPRETKQISSKIAPVVQGLLLNTGTLDVESPPGTCHHTADECQYQHLERLRHQYFHPFKLFCEEMDTISDSCLTGICLAMPGMPWSIALSRLVFLLKSMLDSHGSNYTSSDMKCLSAGTTIGCSQHIKYIGLAEVMAIQDWRDFMRWAHHQSHVFNLCGRRGCIKLQHICLEPIDCMMSRKKCQADSDAVHNKSRQDDQPANKPKSLTPPTCHSPGCYPPCLPRHKGYSLSHSVAVEFSALHRVSFGPQASVVEKEPYTLINEHQLGKLVHDEDVGLIFPFKKSYGHIFIDKWEDESFVRVDTLLEIPPMYTSAELRPILDGLPAWTETSFNTILDSLFWYARKRSLPVLAGASGRSSRSFDSKYPRYECPFCRGFDNFFNTHDSFVESPTDFDDFLHALRHMIFDHAKVPLTRKIKFFLEEIHKFPVIGDAWKAILGEKYKSALDELARGVLPREIINLCGDRISTDSMPTAVGVSSKVHECEENVATKSEILTEIEGTENPSTTHCKIGGSNTPLAQQLDNCSIVG